MSGGSEVLPTRMAYLWDGKGVSNRFTSGRSCTAALWDAWVMCRLMGTKGFFFFFAIMWEEGVCGWGETFQENNPCRLFCFCA